MKKHIVEQEERQSDIQRRLQLIEERCIDATNQMKQDLLRGRAVKIQNGTMNGISNEILKFGEMSEQRNVNEKVEEQLIGFFTKFLNEFIDDKYQQLSECSNEKEVILEEVSKSYNDYKQYSYWLQKMFYYLDLDKFAMPARNTTLSNTSLKLFKIGYFEKSKQKILNTILQFVQEARKNNIQMNIQVNILIELFKDMGQKDVQLKYYKQTENFIYVSATYQADLAYYNKEFEINLLKQLQNYYKAEISEKCKLTTSEFVYWGNSVFLLELQMANDFYLSSGKYIQDILNILFVSDQAEQLVKQETGVIFMLQSDKIVELKTLYDYIKRCKPCIKFIAKTYQAYYEQQIHIIMKSQVGDYDGQQINSQQEKMLLLMEKAEQILKNQFQDDPEIRKSFNVVFEKFLNMQKPMQKE